MLKVRRNHALQRQGSKPDVDNTLKVLRESLQRNKFYEYSSVLPIGDSRFTKLEQDVSDYPTYVHRITLPKLGVLEICFISQDNEVEGNIGINITFEPINENSLIDLKVDCDFSFLSSTKENDNQTQHSFTYGSNPVYVPTDSMFKIVNVKAYRLKSPREQFELLEERS